MRLVLFDIDGTLISAGGAGMAAFARALMKVCGVSVDVRMVNPDGKTDPLILKELLATAHKTGLWSESLQNSLFSAYLDCLEEEMASAQKSQTLSILPGAKEILEIISRQCDCCLGLVTGNLEQGARIKLEHAGFWDYFRFGGYGSDSENRTELARAGIDRGIKYIAPKLMDKAFIIGDTPLDILHGRAAGAGVIAVAAGRYGMDSLAGYAPDLLVPDLTHTEEIMAFLKAGACRNP